MHLYPSVLWLWGLLVITLTPVDRWNTIQLLEMRNRFFSERPMEPMAVYKRHGVIIHTDGEITGYYVLAPYAPFAYPKPWFPDHWRPMSNFAHFVALANKSGSLHNLFSLLQKISTDTDMRCYYFPLTITAFAESIAGIRLLKLCGFEEITDRFYAVTITEGLHELVEHAKRTFASNAYMGKTIVASTPAVVMPI